MLDLSEFGISDEEFDAGFVAAIIQAMAADRIVTAAMVSESYHLYPNLDNLPATKGISVMNEVLIRGLENTLDHLRRCEAEGWDDPEEDEFLRIIEGF